MKYAIVCDARKGKDLGITHLALVDRSRFRQFWWTSDGIDFIKTFNNKEEAQKVCNKYKYNNPRVVDYKEVVELLKSQNEEIIHNEALVSVEAGWDGHKEII